MARIAVVVPVLNNFKGCIESFRSIETRYNWTPIIIPQWEKNWPLSAAWNEGIAQARERQFDYVLVMNDDILCSKYTVDTLVDFLETGDPDIIMITGCNVAGAFMHDPESILTWEDDEVINGAKGNFAEHPDFSFIMIRPNFCQIVGAFDENFTPAYMEDNDMHRRIKVLGYRAGSTSAAPYYHFGSVTANKIRDESFHKAFRDNQEYYVRKWGGMPGNETFDHPYDMKELTPKQWLIRHG